MSTPVGPARRSGLLHDAGVIGENERLATVGLRVEPGDGVSFHLAVELGSMPYACFRP